MKVYFGALNQEVDTELDSLKNAGILHSYFYISKKKPIEQPIFLDSGAFSAAYKGVNINLKDYIQFIHDNAEKLLVYANLDVIGDPKASYKNYRTMKKAGLSPMPTVHFGTDKKWIHKYIDKGNAYIGLGGLVPESTRNIHKWVSEFKDLFDEVGFHGFGMSDIPLMLNYNWKSVDFTTHAVAGRMGEIYFYNAKKTNLHRVVISENRTSHINHINHKPPVIKKAILKSFDITGTCLEALVGNAELRALHNGKILSNFINNNYESK